MSESEALRRFHGELKETAFKAIDALEREGVDLILFFLGLPWIICALAMTIFPRDPKKAIKYITEATERIMKATGRGEAA